MCIIFNIDGDTDDDAESNLANAVIVAYIEYIIYQISKCIFILLRNVVATLLQNIQKTCLMPISALLLLSISKYFTKYIIWNLCYI